MLKKKCVTQVPSLEKAGTCEEPRQNNGAELETNTCCPPSRSSEGKDGDHVSVSYKVEVLRTSMCVWVNENMYVSIYSDISTWPRLSEHRTQAC